MSLATSLRVGVFLAVSASAYCVAQDQLPSARARMDDLRFAAYATSAQVEELARDDAARARAWNAIQRMGITKVIIEVYRGGHVVSAADLTLVRDWLREKGLDVVGGIATVPGGDFGVRQEGPLGWFNWQNPKTQRDLSEVMRSTAPLFDAFIVDDVLCTGDVSQESQSAKGDRSWSVYRRALMTEMARSVLVGPAKEANPSITMIVKYPQWYDRFQLFGYDTETLPRIFDQVWVGTETRGRTTQRFGFVQPYEGFVNYRRLADLAGGKIGGAWFDHGDCGPHDFLDQAYMTVLAGAREIVFFNLGDLVAGHPDHELVIAEFDRLADLAAFVRTHPVAGIPAYMPPNSDPAGDMFLLDYLGMLGIPLVPVHEFPENAPVVFLPAHAAADSQLLARVRKAHDRGARLILTTNLLIAAPESRQLTRLAGLHQELRSQPLRAQLMPAAPTPPTQPGATDVTVDLESPLEAAADPGNILCTAEGRRYALLVAAAMPTSRVAVLNTHTFNQADFDAVGEVLLSPRQLGLLTLNGEPLRALRAAFRGEQEVVFDGPSSVTWQPLQDGAAGDCVVQNYNDHAVQVTLTVPLRPGQPARCRDAFTGAVVAGQTSTANTSTTLDVTLPARGRVWLRSEE